RPVVEHMPQVRAAVTAVHFGPLGEETVVHLGLHRLFRERRKEAGPPRPRIELGIGGKQGLTAARAPVHPRLVMIPVDAGECRLRPLFPADAKPLRRELLPPFLFLRFPVRRHAGLPFRSSLVTSLPIHRRRSDPRPGRSGHPERNQAGGAAKVVQGRFRVKLPSLYMRTVAISFRSTAMSLSGRWALSLILLAGAAGTAQAQQTMPADSLEHARTLATQFLWGALDSVYAHFSPQLKGQVSVADLQDQFDNL